jgi:dolichyl-phosphate-mannose--protein O-mannosyl transferase
MKSYIITTGVIFALLALAHVWRVIEEGPSLLTNPWWVVVTLVAAALCIWACRLIWRAPADR